jgi:hypothetical protein
VHTVQLAVQLLAGCDEAVQLGLLINPCFFAKLIEDDRVE